MNIFIPDIINFFVKYYVESGVLNTFEDHLGNIAGILPKWYLKVTPFQNEI